MKEKDLYLLIRLAGLHLTGHLLGRAVAQET